MPSNTAYTPDDDDDEEKTKQEWVESRGNDRIYSYDDAFDLTGHGWYTVGLVSVLSIANLFTAVEVFGFSVILSGAKCEYDLDLVQTGTLLTIAFIGPTVMAYPWGYLADTQGRRRCLLISLWTSCFFSMACAFSPNWITIGVLKLLSTSLLFFKIFVIIAGKYETVLQVNINRFELSSSHNYDRTSHTGVTCGQTTTYTLLGESCPRHVRDAYMLVLASSVDMSLAFYMGIGYAVLNQDFSLNLGIITISSWRFLTIIMALPLGISAFGLHFFYESPRFLYNAGKEEEAIEALKGICERNGGDMKKYPVKTIFLNEDSFRQPKGISVLLSLWKQIVPLFKPPLLKRSLQLYFITVVVFGTNNSYFMWIPFLAEQFVAGLSQDNQVNTGLCEVIMGAYDNSTQTSEFPEECSSTIDIGSFFTSLIQGITFVLVLLSVTKIAHRKRLLMIAILFVSGTCAILAVTVKENITSLIMFFGLLINELVIGIIYTYIVELYPTSYRGTAASLAAMVARISAIGGVSLIGAFIMTHCDVTFYASAVIMFCGVLVGFLLPPDKLGKEIK